jgi:hypothetical protein
LSRLSAEVFHLGIERSEIVQEGSLLHIFLS